MVYFNVSATRRSVSFLSQRRTEGLRAIINFPQRPTVVKSALEPMSLCLLLLPVVF